MKAMRPFTTRNPSTAPRECGNPQVQETKVLRGFFVYTTSMVVLMHSPMLSLRIQQPAPENAPGERRI